VTLWIGGIERIGLLEDLKDDRLVVRLAPLGRGGPGDFGQAAMAAAGAAPAVGYPVQSLDPGMWLRKERLGEAVAERLTGLALLCEGRRVEAARALARAADLGEEVSAYRGHLDRLGPP
jgi:hypothetical protein